MLRKSSAKARRAHRSTFTGGSSETLAELPHFNNAKRYVGTLATVGVIFATIGLWLIRAVATQSPIYRSFVFIFPSALAYLGAALLIGAAGLLSTGIVAYVRERLVDSDRRGSSEAKKSSAPVPAWARSKRLRRSINFARTLVVPSTLSLATWPATLVVLLFGALAARGVLVGWFGPPQAAGDPMFRQVLGGALLVAAFPILVLERSYAAIPAEMLPDAPHLNRLLRVPLTACLGLGISLILFSLGFTWAIWIQVATSLLIAAVALELILRSAAMFFVPYAPIERLRTTADSSLAGLLRFSMPDFSAFNASVRQQFGIDLSRSWALAFLQRAVLPVIFGMLLMAWGTTGITALKLNQRAVYERLGVPVAVLGPGLHFHLPWPMGIIREVELGTVHNIPIAIEPIEDSKELSRLSTSIDQQPDLVNAEAPAPISADRLWDAMHPSEQSYLIASETSGQQSFQIADADLRIVYRVGLSDAAATDYTFRVANPETFIRAAAGQLLVRYFARYTLLDVLGQNRETFANDFRTALQDQLDRMSSGIEAIAVVVEAIHPPPGAASAYHNVQAAEIRATAQISEERARAIQNMKSAEMNATAVRNRALAAAAELVDGAKSESVLFDADRQAQQRENDAFLLERWFERLASAVTNSDMIVIDHRLGGQNAPTIDLRNFAAGRSDTASPPDKPSDDENEFTAPKSQPNSGSQR